MREGPEITMNRLSYSVADLLERGAMEQPRELRQLFHQLNNQLGIILAHAELLEKKAADETSRSRATQVVSSVLDAMGTAKEIRMQMGKRASDVYRAEGRKLRISSKLERLTLKRRIPSFLFHLHRRSSGFCIWDCAELQLVTPKTVIRNCH